MRELTTQFLGSLQVVEQVSIDKVIDPNLQSQTNKIPTKGTFLLKNQQMYLLLLLDHDEWATLNLRWGRSDTQQVWALHWKQLWGLDLTKRAKILVQHIIMNNTYNMVREKNQVTTMVVEVSPWGNSNRMNTSSLNITKLKEARQLWTSFMKLNLTKICQMHFFNHQHHQ